MFEFGSLLMQSSSVGDLTALIVAVSAAIGTIGALVASVSAKIKASSHDERIQRIAGDSEAVGKLATAFAQKTAEQSGELETIASVVTNLSPEAKKLLEDKDKDLTYWKDRADTANAQLNRLLPLVEGGGQANSMVDLPRESPKTIGALRSTP